jgi:hypothetical protein
VKLAWFLTRDSEATAPQQFIANKSIYKPGRRREKTPTYLHDEPRAP